MGHQAELRSRRRAHHRQTRAVAALLLAFWAPALPAAGLSGCRTEAEAAVRSASPAELSPPPGALDRLSKVLGATFTAPDVTMVDAAIASDAAGAIAQTEYGAQAADARPSQFLQAATGLDGLHGSEAVWIVVYADLEIPVLAPGGATSDAVIHNIYVVISAETGAFLTAVSTD